MTKKLELQSGRPKNVDFSGSGINGQIANKTADYLTTDSDQGLVIPFDLSSSVLHVVLHTPSISPFYITFQDINGFAATNNLSIISPTVLIDNLAGTDKITQAYGCASYVYDNSIWTRVLYFNGLAPVFARGLFGGGDQSLGTDINTIEYINLHSASNSTDFGDLTRVTEAPGALASQTRGVWGGGTNGPVNIMDYVTIATLGNAIDFGDLTQIRNAPAGCGSNTRGLFGGGSSAGFHNIIDYITIATTGNAIDFGDLTVAGAGPAAASSTVRGIWAGRYNAPTFHNVIDYVTIATTGNATDFGDLVLTRIYSAACASATRMLIGGGDTSPGLNAQIEYITIATTGNAADFGTITVPRWDLGACSSQIYGVWGSGYANEAATLQSNVMDYVVIATLANAVDFGDLSTARDGSIACSNAHGGI